MWIYITSQNIYFTESAKKSKRVHKLNRLKRTIRFNKLHCLDGLTILLINLEDLSIENKDLN